MASNRFLPQNSHIMSLNSMYELRGYDGFGHLVHPTVSDIPDDTARILKHGYYASVSYVDAQFGRVIQHLKDLGIYDNTIIVVWGDHGWKLGEHGSWCKHSNVELDTRSPLICSDPNLPKGQVSNALVEFVDIFPSLCDLGGLNVPGQVEGDSFVPLMKTPNLPWKKAAFSQYPRGNNRMGYSMKTDQYRYTEWVSRDGKRDVLARELYDHLKDPAENMNVVNELAYASVVPNLAKMMLAGWKEARPVN